MKPMPAYMLLVTALLVLVGAACGGATTPTSLPLETAPNVNPPASSEGSEAAVETPQTENTAASSESSDTSSAGGGSTVDPAAVVQVFFVSLYAGGDVSSFVCSETPTLGRLFQQQAANTRAGMDNSTVSIAGLQYTVSDRTTDSALVIVEGEIVFTANGVDTAVPYPQTVIDMVVEGGSWKICGGIA